MKQKNKVRSKKDWSYYVIIVCCVIIAIPLMFLGYVAISASRGKGSPVVGRRFANDLDPAIKKEQLETVLADIKAIEGVTDAKVELKTATLRVYILTSETADENVVTELSNQAFDKVMATLDPQLYFSMIGIQKQYDIEVHAYNQEKPSEETIASYVYVLRMKTSNMSEAANQTLTTAKSQELVDQFREEEKRKKEEAEAGQGSTENTEQETGEGTE